MIFITDPKCATLFYFVLTLQNPKNFYRAPIFFIGFGVHLFFILFRFYSSAFLNISSPLVVNSCSYISLIILYGIVAISAPANIACSTWLTFLIDAAIIFE